MSVIQRGKFFHYRFMAGGILYRGSTKQTSLGRAQTFERNLIARILEGDAPAPGKMPRLSDFAADFKKHIEAREKAGSMKPNSVKAYKNGCRLLSATRVWRYRVDQITRATAAELSFPGGGYNQNRGLRTLRAILGHAEEIGIIKAAPRIDLREEEGRERLIAPWEETLILKHACPVLRDVLTIMLDCGMRPDEVCRMKWEDIRWQEGSVLVERGKSRRARRHVGLTERMRTVLAGTMKRNEKWKRQDSPYVFPSPRSKTGHVKWLAANWARTLDRVNAVRQLAPGLVPYSARHTYATNYLKAGGDVGQLSRLMGHSDIGTTMRYVHMIEAAESAKVMDRHNRTKLEIVRRQA